MPHRLEEAVVKTTVQQMSNNSLTVLVGNIVSSVVIGFYYWWLTQGTFFLLWTAGMVALLIARSLAISFIVHGRSERFSFHFKHDLLCVGMLVTGLGWSSMAQYVFLNLEPGQHSLMYISMAGVVSAALATSAGSIRGFAFFSLPILLPMAMLHIALGNAEQMLLGTFVLIYAAIMTIASLHIARYVRETSTYHFENKALLDNLVKEKEHIMMLNDRLQQDMKKRVGVMEWLASGRRDRGDMAEEMHVLSSRDALTGLANRRRFNELLSTEWARARRDQTPIALIKCDIDHFKTFNDALGQQEGDLCLATLAGCLSKFARRTTDLVARYGEDEFVILLPGIGEADALSIAEEVRTAVMCQSIPHPAPEENSQVTLTLGVAAITPSRHTTEMTLIKQADIALYRAKQVGRNRVNSYADSDQLRKVTLRDLINPRGRNQG